MCRNSRCSTSSTPGTYENENDTGVSVRVRDNSLYVILWRCSSGQLQNAFTEGDPIGPAFVSY